MEDPASGLNGWYVWIIDYSKYAFNVESITVKGNCDGFWLEGLLTSQLCIIIPRRKSDNGEAGV